MQLGKIHAKTRMIWIQDQQEILFWKVGVKIVEWPDALIELSASYEETIE